MATSAHLSFLSFSDNCHRVSSTQLVRRFAGNPVPVSRRCCRRAKQQVKVVSQKRGSGRSKDAPDGAKGETGRSQSTLFRALGVQKKDKQNFVQEIKEQQVNETTDLQDSTFLNAVVKVFCTHTAPDYSLPWQKQRQYTSTGSAFMIGNGKLLTNAHCVEHDTQVKVKRRGDDTKFVAKVLARGIECDIALLSVESEEFWKGAEPLRLGRLPCLQDSVTVVGYPLGGDTISVSKGVVSRIEVTSYAHGATDLLGIQIDAAINPGNSGGPAFNDQGECIGIAFQVFRSDDAENIGYVIPTTVVSHFLNDYERNGKYTGFPSLGVLLQKLENPALRRCLKVQSNEGVLVRKVEPTSPASSVLKEGDVIVSFDGTPVGCEGTVPFRSTERIAFRYLISQKFAGDVSEVGIIRGGVSMKVQTVLYPRVHLVPYHIEGGQPSYLIVAGLVFTPLSEPLIDEECEDSIGLKLLAKARYSFAKFKGEQIVILSQVLAHEANIGYEDMGNQQHVKTNTWFSSLKIISLLYWRGKQQMLHQQRFSRIMAFHVKGLGIYLSHTWIHQMDKLWSWSRRMFLLQTWKSVLMALSGLDQQTESAGESMAWLAWAALSSWVSLSPSCKWSSSQSKSSRFQPPEHDLILIDSWLLTMGCIPL